MNNLFRALARFSTNHKGSQNPESTFKRPSEASKIKLRKIKKKMLYLALFAGGLQLWSQYYKTNLLFYNNELPHNKLIIENCKELRKGFFKPTFYLPTPFMQVVYGAKFDPTPYIPFERELHELPDQGVVALDWAPIHHIYEKKSKEEKEKLSVLIITHGLTGGSETNYIRHAVQKGTKNGYRVVVINNRGVAGSPLKTSKYHSAGSVEDLKSAIDYISTIYPNANLYGLGISMGALMLCNYASIYNTDCKLKGMVSIANPFDIVICSKEMSHWSKYIYDNNMTKGFIKLLKANMEELKANHGLNGADIEQALKATRTREFDEVFTRRIFGYRSVDEYYRDVSCWYRLQEINIPVLFLSSLDDPVVDKKVIPIDDIKKKPNFLLVCSQRGGHIDWFTTKSAIRWVYSPMIQYLNYLDKGPLVLK